MNVSGTKPKFIVDFMLGRLAKWLRIFGFDTLYLSEKERKDSVLNSLKENRILLTRDHRLSGKRAWKLILVEKDNLLEQIKQIIVSLNLSLSEDDLFSRCSACNCAIETVTDKNSIKNEVPGYIYQTHTVFSRCPNCRKIYWMRTHLDLFKKDLKKKGIKIE
jgi:uncharacterized protein with PIN domain